MNKPKSIQIYLKPGIEEEELLLDAWALCAQRSRPQVVFRRMLYEGLRVLLSQGELPAPIQDELAQHRALRTNYRPFLPQRTPSDKAQLLKRLATRLENEEEEGTDGDAAVDALTTPADSPPPSQMAESRKSDVPPDAAEQTEAEEVGLPRENDEDSPALMGNGRMSPGQAEASYPPQQKKARPAEEAPKLSQKGNRKGSSEGRPRRKLQRIM